VPRGAAQPKLYRDIHYTRFGEHGVPDDVYAAAREQFDERELTYLVGAIAMINMWNRLAITFQSTPRSARTRSPVSPPC